MVLEWPVMLLWCVTRLLKWCSRLLGVAIEKWISLELELS